MQEMEVQIPDGTLYYIRQGHGIEITRYHGLAGHVEIPETLPVQDPGSYAQSSMDGACAAQDSADHSLPVKKISKKAFLSKKYLRSVSIPEGVEEVGDWAFAYCDALREVRFGGRNVHFGKAVFMECHSLRNIYLPVPAAEDVAALLAAAVTRMESAYLLDADDAGSPEWMSKWDARMLAILHTPDDEGYSKQILCGEEDYESADLETFLKNSRKKKVRLCLLRLLFPLYLGSGQQEELKAYLLAHTKGCASEETWEVIRSEYGNDREFYELFTRLGCFTAENAAAIIAETSEQYPEMKAYFLKAQADTFGTQDFFADLTL